MVNGIDESGLNTSRQPGAAAMEAVDQFVEIAGDEGKIRASVSRTVGTLATYGPSLLSQNVYDTAVMTPLGDHLQIPNERRRYVAAGMGILAYFTSQNNYNTHQENGYVGTLMGDMPHLAALANGFEARLSQYRSAQGLTNDDGVMADDWRSLRVGANIPDLAMACYQNNIESILVRSAYVADRLTHPRDDELELLREISRVETFYAPLLEILGLHAFDMMMRSNVDKIRFMKSGDNTALQLASDTMRRAKDIEIEDIFEQLLGIRPREHTFSTNANSLLDENIIYSSTDASELGMAVDAGEIRSRFKGVGNYARKIIENPEYDANPESTNKPMDVFGLLAVLPDAGAVGQLFGYVADRVRRNDHIYLHPAGKKWSPFYIQGSKDYVRQVVSQLPSDLADLVQVKPEDCAASDIFQVSKFTCFINFGDYLLPVEFQFQTEADRANARIGKLSHMSYHSGDGIGSVIPGKSSDLRYINERRKRIDNKNIGRFVNGQSIPHGEEFTKSLYRAMEAQRNYDGDDQLKVA